MSTGTVIAGLARRACRAYGQMEAIVQAQRMTRSGVTGIAAEFEDVARTLRSLVEVRQSPVHQRDDPDCSAALMGSA